MSPIWPLPPSPWAWSFRYKLATRSVTGISALANGGVLRPATILKRAESDIPAGERIISLQTSEQVRALMREKARLVLCLMVWQRPNLLLLDEPTNHLDLATREALGLALNAFEGTVMRMHGGGLGLTITVRRIVEKLKMEQMALLAARDSEAYRQAQTTRWTVGTGVALNFILLAVAGWLMWDDVRARRRAAAVLREANDQLESKVRERTAELAKANGDSIVAEASYNDNSKVHDASMCVQVAEVEVDRETGQVQLKKFTSTDFP